ncbi:MAG: chromate resistance protein ChrB domain-containing protein [Rhodospirillaceae bacterium]
MTPTILPPDRPVSVDQFWRLVGTPDCPLAIDARTPEDFAADPRLIPGAVYRPGLDARAWASEFAGRQVVVDCQRGLKISQGVAAYARAAGAGTLTLEGGFVAWRDAGLPLVSADAAGPRDGQGRSHWVIRARPKVDRIACPWLIRRFVDREAVFLFVQASEVMAVADKFGATPFDVDGAHWNHRGDKCTFDAMVEDWGLAADPALVRLAQVVRGADTGRPDLTPEPGGLVAVSLGLSSLIADDLKQLDRAMVVYDALYSWARGAVATGTVRHGVAA